MHVHSSGWVEIRAVEMMAGHRALAPSVVQEALENWSGLEVLQINDDKTMSTWAKPLDSTSRWCHTAAELQASRKLLCDYYVSFLST
eukprot:4169339-Amphidinium_carterae.1